MMQLMKNRRIRFFIAFLSLFLLFDMIQNSYAKYVSSAEATNNLTIAKWAFQVNDQDVLTNSDFSNTITPVFPGSNYVNQGYIAPNSEGYFDIEIDSSNVDVSFNETITIGLDTTNTVSDLVITKYQINGGSIINFQNNQNSITTSHALNDQNSVNTYRIYVKWLEGSGETMNNAADTNASKNGIAAIAITINFIQTTSSS